MKTRKLGKFKVDLVFFKNLEVGQGHNLFHKMIILEVKQEWEYDCIEYIGVHEQFAEVPKGQIIPEYVAIFFNDSIYPRWEMVE